MMGGTPPTDNQQSANNVPQSNAAPKDELAPLPYEPATQSTVSTPVPENASFATAPAMATPMTPAQNIALRAQYNSAGDSGNKKASATLIETIILIIVCLIAAGAVIFAVSYFTKYHNLQSNYNVEKESAVAEAVKARADADEAAFLEREKEPYNEWSGPSDYGSLSFKYPKTWSTYLDKDGSNGSDYSVYFAPSVVNNINDLSSRYALRFKIYNMQYSEYVGNLEQDVESGKLSASTFNEQDGQLTGIRYEGEIDTDTVGIKVVIKVNDKTAVFRTDSENYRADFDKLIDSLRRNS